MEEVCEAGPKNLRKNFRAEEHFSAQNASRYFPLFKKRSYVNTETRYFMQLFEHLLVCLYDLNVFLYEPGM